MTKEAPKKFMLCSCPEIGGTPVQVELNEGEGKSEAEAKFRQMVNGLKGGTVCVIDPDEPPEVRKVRGMEDANEEIRVLMEQKDNLTSQLAELTRVNETLTTELADANGKLGTAEVELTAARESLKLAEAEVEGLKKQLAEKPTDKPDEEENLV